MCALGLPAILIDVAENQRSVAEELGRKGCAIHLGNKDNISPENLAAALRSLLLSKKRRSAISQRAHEIVDGEGAMRVASAIRTTGIRLRPAGREDSRLLWEWANDPDVRAGSFSSGSIPWEEHSTWFNKKLEGAKCLILIATDRANNPIGQIRFDMTSDREAEVSLSIAREVRGRRYAASLIETAVETMFEQRNVERLHAFVKPENQSSQKAFEKANFAKIGVELRGGNLAVHYTRTKNQVYS
jgi:RimJ/RimL family protein N-acetyltransferase